MMFVLRDEKTLKDSGMSVLECLRWKINMKKISCYQHNFSEDYRSSHFTQSEIIILLWYIYIYLLHRIIITYGHIFSQFIHRIWLMSRNLSLFQKGAFKIMSLFLGSLTPQVDTSPANELIFELRNAKI